MELLVVLAIVALLGGIAAPRYASSLAHYRADVAARRVAADLALAQVHARMTSVTQTVTFNTAAQSYQLSNLSGLDAGASAYVVQLNAEPYRCTFASVSFSGNQISFNNYGVPSTGGTVVVQAGNWQKTLTIDPDTGRVTIQ